MLEWFRPCIHIWIFYSCVNFDLLTFWEGNLLLTRERLV